MHVDGAVDQTSSQAVRRLPPRLRTCLTFILGAIVFCAIALAAPRPGGKTAGVKRSAAPASDFVGSDTCATCHEEVAKGFASEPAREDGADARHQRRHLRKLPRSGQGARGRRRRYHQDLQPRQGHGQGSRCQVPGCHQGQHSNFERSGHGEANVSCVGCHSIHAGNDPEQLLKAAQPVLCFQCHTDVKPQLLHAVPPQGGRGPDQVLRLPRSPRNVRTQGLESRLAAGRGLHEVPRRDRRTVRV